MQSSKQTSENSIDDKQLVSDLKKYVEDRTANIVIDGEIDCRKLDRLFRNKTNDEQGKEISVNEFNETETQFITTIQEKIADIILAERKLAETNSKDASILRKQLEDELYDEEKRYFYKSVIKNIQKYTYVEREGNPELNAQIKKANEIIKDFYDDIQDIITDSSWDSPILGGKSMEKTKLYNMAEITTGAVLFHKFTTDPDKYKQPLNDYALFLQSHDQEACRRAGSHMTKASVALLGLTLALVIAGTALACTGVGFIASIALWSAAGASLIASGGLYGGGSHKNNKAATLSGLKKGGKTIDTTINNEEKPFIPPDYKKK